MKHIQVSNHNYITPYRKISLLCMQMLLKAFSVDYYPLYYFYVFNFSLACSSAATTYVAPPLIVIPMKDIYAYPQNTPPPPSPPPVEIKTKGDEFWKGW